MQTCSSGSLRRLHMISRLISRSFQDVEPLTILSTSENGIIPRFCRTKHDSTGRKSIRASSTNYSVRPTSNGRQGPMVAYNKLLETRQLISGDTSQEVAAIRLQELYENLHESINSRQSWRFHMQHVLRFSAAQVRGVYLYGGVGTGKTMMMDLFYQSATCNKLRSHFHAFMLDIHSRLHNLKDSYAVKLRQKDPVAMVAEQLSVDYRLICLDEVEVTDIADALIFLRLFSVLWQRGVILVATSNNAPEQLYRNGLNFQLFESFSPLLRNHCDVLSLDKGTDYRSSPRGSLPVFLSPLDPKTSAAMDSAFDFLTGGSSGQGVQSKEVRVMMGRSLTVPLAANEVARFSFDDICGQPMGAADYLALADEFRVIFIDRIPSLADPAMENATRRFVTLIDILYERNRILLCSSQVAIDAIFSSDVGISSIGESLRRNNQLLVVGEGGSSGRSSTMIGGMEWSATGIMGASLATIGGYSSFTKLASRRTKSRLQEMCSMDYVSQDAIGKQLIRFFNFK